MRETIAINSNHSLVGNWKAADDFSDVAISISAEANGFLVSVVDEADCETAEVFDPHYDGDVLSFAAYWPSNGRLIKWQAY